MAPPAPTCPRCGYDQSGIITTWDTAGACPLHGRCTECGSPFDWGAVLDPLRVVKCWSFEHADRRRALRWIQTALFLAVPWAFWRRLEMTHALRPARIALFLCAGVLLAHMAAAVFTAAAVGWHFHLSNCGFSMCIRRALRSALWPYADLRALQGITDDSPSLWLIFMMWPLIVSPAGAAGLLGALAVLGRPLPRLGHVARIACYAAFPWVAWGPILLAYATARGVVFDTPMLWLGSTEMIIDGRVLLVVMVWFMCVWWFAITRYLRVRAPMLVAIGAIALTMVIALNELILVGLVMQSLNDLSNP